MSRPKLKVRGWKCSIQQNSSAHDCWGVHFQESDPCLAFWTCLIAELSVVAECCSLQISYLSLDKNGLRHPCTIPTVVGFSGTLTTLSPHGSWGLVSVPTLSLLGTGVTDSQ